jgi:predicted metal-dependent hydrolase
MIQAENFVRSRANWVEEKLRHLQSLPPSPLSQYTPEHYRQHKASARKILTEKLALFATRYGFTYRSIAIRNQKTCWGSCSRNRIISLNYKIIFLPEAIQDYILIHELCHLKEMNHSVRFWALVERIMPDYQARRVALRKVGLGMLK